MNNHLSGFLVSAFFHLGIISLFFASATFIPPSREQAEIVPLKLTMFKLPSPSQPKPEPVIETPPEPIVQNISEPAPPKSKPKLKPKIKSKPIVKLNPKPQPATTIEAVSASKPPTQPQLTPAPVPISPSPEMPAQAVLNPTLVERAENEYRARLQAAIEEHKKYPRRARRLRQQGSVSVSFKVQKNGSIKDLRVVSGSDNTILDKAALATVQQVSSLFPLPEELNRNEWAFTVPINYYLR